MIEACGEGLREHTLCMQGEERAALNAASQGISNKLTLRDSDMIMYAASVIPGNGKKVQQMFNRVANLGAKISNSPADGLHTRCAAQRAYRSR